MYDFQLKLEKKKKRINSDFKTSNNWIPNKSEFGAVLSLLVG